MKRSPMKRTSSLKARSAKRRREQKERHRLGKLNLDLAWDEPCWLAIPGVCWGFAEAWPELVGAGVGGSKIDPRNLCASCGGCNTYLEGADERYVRGWKVPSSEAKKGDGGLVPGLLHPLSLAARKDAA